MNNAQESIVSHQRGPLCVIAGPGSGKTRSILLLVLNLLLSGNAQPSEVILCTYAEKVAYEMQDRLIKFAETIDYRKDLSQLRIGTIHSICKQLLIENIHYTNIESDFTTLDQFAQQLLIFEHIHEICKPPAMKFFHDYWGSTWNIAKELSSLFNIVTEDLILDKLKATYNKKNISLSTENDKLRYYLTYTYTAYQKMLQKRNCLDFAHQQKCIYNLLKDPQTFPHVTKGLRYIIVDEYQDTSYIQEQILILLASATSTNNLCVVGDEDQALYRFRGATIRNILGFKQAFPESRKIYLMTNYRSHTSIIDMYNTWITSINWTNHQGVPVRTEKHVQPISSRTYPNYSAVYTAVYDNPDDEAEQFAEIVASLKTQGKIHDYSQVALLLRSVKPNFSSHYIKALQRKNIPFFCPRARSYFDQKEIRLIIGCFARILDYNADPLENEFLGEDLREYLGNCQRDVEQACLTSSSLQKMLFTIKQEFVHSAEDPDTSNTSLTDYFYRFITAKPFLTYVKGDNDHEEPLHNLELFSQLLHIFQRYYRHSVVTLQNRNRIAHDFFQKFLSLLHIDGLNQYEDTHQPIPEGHVPILTIHQAKGLEFPVVVVGRLDKLAAFSDSQKQKVLQDLSEHPFIEPDQLIPAFDQHRLYYVAFSRAKNLLVLTASKRPGTSLAPLWQKLPLWKQADLHHMPESEFIDEQCKSLPRYGFTSHIQLYNTCPRQYYYFRAHHFTPSSTKESFVGQLVHHTLEHIHCTARDGRLSLLNEEMIEEFFERKFQALIQTHQFPIDTLQKDEAQQQVLRYFRQNQELLQNILDAEFPIQISKKNYILAGKIDLLVKSKHGLTLIDFKTHARAINSSSYLEQYKQQVHFYANALELAGHPRPKHLFLYWTAEEHKEDALMEIAYSAEKIAMMDQTIEETVSKIEQKKFHVWKPPAAEICQRCDLRHLCLQDRVIKTS
jgi:DNA helicase-2/ATP-dependent DNA helicase PcrA